MKSVVDAWCLVEKFGWTDAAVVEGWVEKETTSLFSIKFCSDFFFEPDQNSAHSASMDCYGRNQKEDMLHLCRSERLTLLPHYSFLIFSATLISRYLRCMVTFVTLFSCYQFKECVSIVVMWCVFSSLPPRVKEERGGALHRECIILPKI